VSLLPNAVDIHAFKLGVYSSSYMQCHSGLTLLRELDGLLSLLVNVRALDIRVGRTVEVKALQDNAVLERVMDHLPLITKLRLDVDGVDDLLVRIARYRLRELDLCRVTRHLQDMLCVQKELRVLRVDQLFLAANKCVFDCVAQSRLTELRVLCVTTRVAGYIPTDLQAMETHLRDSFRSMVGMCTRLRHLSLIVTKLVEDKTRLDMWECMELLSTLFHLDTVEINSHLLKCEFHATKILTFPALKYLTMKKQGHTISRKQLDGLCLFRWPSLVYLGVECLGWTDVTIGSLLDNAPHLENVKFILSQRLNTMDKVVKAIGHRPHLCIKTLQILGHRISSAYTLHHFLVHVPVLQMACPHATIHVVLPNKQCTTVFGSALVWPTKTGKEKASHSLCTPLCQ
jgi:hypothetical protein